MDIPTAVAIAVPVSTFIVTVDTIFLKTRKKNPGGGSISRESLNSLLKEKLDKDVCDERVKRIEASVSSLQEFVKQQFVSFAKEISQLRHHKSE